MTLIRAEPTFIRATARDYEQEPAVRLAAEALLHAPIDQWTSEEGEFIQLCIERGLLDWIEEINNDRLGEFRRSRIVAQAARAIAKKATDESSNKLFGELSDSTCIALSFFQAIIATIVLCIILDFSPRHAPFFFVFSLILIMGVSLLSIVMGSFGVYSPFLSYNPRKAKIAELLEKHRKERAKEQRSIY
jgi:F0F1-type ATP synthase assembly protein I